MYAKIEHRKGPLGLVGDRPAQARQTVPREPPVPNDLPLVATSPTLPSSATPDVDGSARPQMVAEPNRLTMIGRYEVASKIGEGAMGIVYLAYDPRLYRSVAIKTFALPKGLVLAPDQERVVHQRFIREARAASAVSHPGIVTIYDADLDSERGLPFIAMEYVPGRSLQELLDADGRLEPERALAMASALANALHTAHEADIVHRDIKPANILVREPDGALKITDFGVARAPVEYDHARTSDLTQPGVTVSPLYMAPEQLAGRVVDQRSDLFSLAVILYQALSGKRPFDGQDLVSLVYAIVHEPPVPITQLVPGLPYQLDRFFERALAKDPAARFQNGAAFGKALEEALPIHKARPTIARTKLERRTRLPARPSLAAALLLFLVLGGWSFSRKNEPYVPISTEGAAREEAGPPTAAIHRASDAAVVKEHAYLRLLVKSSVPAGTLTFFVDGEAVHSQPLSTKGKKVKRFFKKVFGRGQEFETRIKVAPGDHDLVARVTLVNGSGSYERGIVVDLESGESRTLRLVAGRTFGRPLSMKLVGPTSTRRSSPGELAPDIAFGWKDDMRPTLASNQRHLTDI